MQTHEMRPVRNPLDAVLFLILRIFFALCIIAGCYGLALNARQGSYAAQQKRTDQLYEGLEPGQPLVQSFQSDRAWLTTLVFYASRLKADANPGVNLTVRLRHPGADKDLAAGQFYLGQVGEQEMLTFTFPPLENSKDTPYEFVVETGLPAGSVGIWTSAEDDYGEGTLTNAGKPLAFDLSFFTYYRAPVLATLNAENLHFFANMLLMLAFYLALGVALLLLFGFTEHETPLDALAALLALGIAFLPALFALMSLASIKINATSLTTALVALCALSAAACFYRWKFLGRRLQIPSLRAFFASRDWFFWSVAVLLAYALFMRAAQADGLYVPNWIDGLVHQRSLDKILESGAQSTSQIYHAGFYAHVILTALLTGLSTPAAMLVSAQLFSALGGLTFLFLASRFLSSRFALLVSAAAYWFLAPFPSYLLTWSRFPFLLGLTLLPVLMVYTMQMLRTGKWRLVFPIALIATGMALIHYGVTVIFLAFLVVWLLVDAASRNQIRALVKTLGWRLPLIVFGLLLPALVLLGPKLARFLLDPASRQSLVDLSQEAAAQIDTLHILSLSAQNGGILVWGMAGVGLVAALVSSRKNAILLLGWYALLWVATWAQIQAWGIAVSSYANIIISASIPLSLLAGFAAETLFAPTPRLLGLFEKIHLNPRWFAALGLLLVILAGSYSQLGTVNPISVLFAQRDDRAAQWIREHTAPGALILVDSFRWGDTYWPSDGGGWLKPLTGRPSTYPHSAQEIAGIDALIVSQKVQYIYLGQGYGELSARHFLDNPAYQVVYQAQGVSILAVKEQP